jgi:predicted transcriptional regulator
MDKYDYLLLDIIQSHKEEHNSLINLGNLERNFWRRIERDDNLNIGDARVGERITNLFLDGLIQIKSGYSLTKKGREELSYQLD